MVNYRLISLALTLAYTFDPRTDETCRELLALLTPFNIGMLTTDE
ncbi:putative transposase, partial [Escherichia coli P0305260.11]